MEVDKRLRELSEELDSLPKYEQDFVLWLLLQDYVNDCEREIEKHRGNYKDLGGELIPREPESVSEYALVNMLHRHYVTAQEMRDVLGYSLW